MLSQARQRADPSALHGLLWSQQANRQCAGPGGEEWHKPSRFIGHTCINKSIGQEGFQILSRTTLHAGRNFLAKEFEEKIWHW